MEYVPNSGELRKIIHVDMDAFFASVEQRDNPAYRGQPLVVGGMNRGVVAAASYEARRYGIRSAMPTVTALRRCPDLIVVKPRFEAYREVSKIVREIFFTYTPLVEPLSLDEAYLDVTQNLQNIKSAILIARRIREEIFKTTALTASAGVSYNKFLAKVASDVKKPNGLFVIQPHEAEAFLETLPVERFFGVGRVTAERLKKQGIYTGKELRAISLNELVRQFGKAGRYFYEVSRGIDNRDVNPRRIARSIGVEHTYAQNVTDSTELQEALAELVKELVLRLRKKRKEGYTLTLKVKLADFRQLTRSVTGSVLLSDEDSILSVAIFLLQQMLTTISGKSIRLLGLTVSNFVEIRSGIGVQLSFDF